MKKEDEEKIEALRALTNSKGWEILRQLAEGQMGNRGNQILHTPLGDNWTSFQQEFAKGEVSGIRLFVLMPDLHIESLELESPTGEDDNAE